MQEDLPKSVKKRLQELVYTAHEAALRQALPALSQHFERWQRGEIDSIHFADRIHEFDSGASRGIYRRFTWSRNADLPMLVAAAIADGLIAEKAVEPNVLPYLQKWLAFIRER